MAKSFPLKALGWSTVSLSVAQSFFQGKAGPIPSHLLNPVEDWRPLGPTKADTYHRYDRGDRKACSLLIYLLRRRKWGFALHFSSGQLTAMGQEKQTSLGSRTKQVLEKKQYKPQSATSTKQYQAALIFQLRCWTHFKLTF